MSDVAVVYITLQQGVLLKQSFIIKNEKQAVVVFTFTSSALTPLQTHSFVYIQI